MTTQKTYVITIIDNNGQINVNGFPTDLQKSLTILNGAMQAIVRYFAARNEIPDTSQPAETLQ